MKNLISRLLTASIFAICLMLTQNAFAQDRFDVQKAGVEPEIKGAAKFSELLLKFLTKHAQIEASGKASDADIKELVTLGQNLKAETGNFRSNLQGLVSKLKNGNRWNEQLDKEFANSIVSPRAKALFQNSGARKILGNDINNAFGSLNTDIDAAINDVKALQAANENREVFFEKASYSSSAGKGKFGCVLLGVGVAAAELAGAKLTAGNLDKIFDKKCGGGSTATT